LGTCFSNAAGLGVFEGEGDYFNSDRSGDLIAADTLARLLRLSNVVVTSHSDHLHAAGAVQHRPQDHGQHHLKAYVANEELKIEVKA
jgi:D-lactate dehydrogenase